MGKYRSYIDLYFLLILILVWVSCSDWVLAQETTEIDVKGVIIDSESGNPIGDAIIFLSNTPIGTSSNIDGEFTVINIPKGEYEMIVSRVGYIRQVFSINVIDTGTIFFEVRLHPKPIQTDEVEIFADAPKKEMLLFFPRETKGTYCVYGKVSTVPIGVFFDDSSLYVYSLEAITLNDEKYLQLWLLYKNLSELPYDFNPMRQIKLHMQGKTYSIDDIYPDSYSAIMPHVDTQQIINKISESVGSSLKALATRQTVFEWELQHSDLLFMFGPRPAILRPSSFEPAKEGSLSSYLYNIFSSSVNVGILKRYLIYPGNSINGCAYFPFPGLDWKSSDMNFTGVANYVYKIEIITPGGSKIIEFIPN